MSSGSATDFAAVIASDAVNHEGAAEPLACRGRGPVAFAATADWLRAAFDELSHEVLHSAVDGELVVLDTMMRGRHVGPFATYDESGAPDQVFAPTGRAFGVRQTHWLRVRDARVVEHWASRDDLGQAQQLGWVPPTPAYLLRCALAKRRLRRSTS